MADFGRRRVDVGGTKQHSGTVFESEEPFSSPNGRALSRRAYRAMLVVHGIAGLVLLALLVTYFVGFKPRFREIFGRLDEVGELPGFSWFAIRGSACLMRLLPLVLAGDATVLYVLGRLLRSRGWPVVVWFILVLVGLVVLDVLLPLGVLSVVLRISSVE